MPKAVEFVTLGSQRGNLSTPYWACRKWWWHMGDTWTSKWEEGRGACRLRSSLGSRTLAKRGYHTSGGLVRIQAVQGSQGPDRNRRVLVSAVSYIWWIKAEIGCSGEVRAWAYLSRPVKQNIRFRLIEQLKAHKWWQGSTKNSSQQVMTESRENVFNKYSYIRSREGKKCEQKRVLFLFIKWEK